jgi:hypothetical protein
MEPSLSKLGLLLIQAFIGTGSAEYVIRRRAQAGVEDLEAGYGRASKREQCPVSTSLCQNLTQCPEKPCLICVCVI